MSDHDTSPEVTLETSPDTHTPSGDAVSTTGADDNRSDSGSITARIEDAMSRAEAELDREDNDGKRQTGDSVSSPEQAARSSGQGDSTLNNDDTDAPGTGASGEPEGTSGQSASKEQAGDSTSKAQSLTPPDSWPEDRREAFAKLPDDGKSLLMTFYREMEKGLKQSFDKLAIDRKELQANYGLEADQLKDLAGKFKAFQSDPAAVISELAEEAGIDVYFNQQTEEIPEFDNQADLVKYLQEHAQKEARQAAANEAKALKEQRQQEQVKQQLEQEFADAYKEHKDLADHKDAVIHYIGGYNLPVEMAYRLATYEGLHKLATEGQSLKAELDKTRSELEKLQKLSTMPPGRPDGRSRRPKANGVDMFESAYNSAEQTIRSRS